MALYLHVGPSGSGKSHRLLRTVITEAEKDINRNVLLIVPEQVSMQATSALVEAHPGHTIMNADVLSFMRLAYRVFDELGVGVPDVLDDTGKSMIAKKVALDLVDKLTVYKGLVRRKGFIDELKSLICEFYQYGITDENLGEILSNMDESDRLYAKLCDVRVLFNGFREFLKDRFIMNEELLDLLAGAVWRSDVVKGSVLAFDGFTGFTAPQYRLMESLLRVAQDVHVTVTVDTDQVDMSGCEVATEDSMFFLSLQTIEKMKELAKLSGQRVIMDCAPHPGYRYIKINVDTGSEASGSEAGTLGGEASGSEAGTLGREASGNVAETAGGEASGNVAETAGGEVSRSVAETALSLLERNVFRYKGKKRAVQEEIGSTSSNHERIGSTNSNHERIGSTNSVQEEIGSTNSNHEGVGKERAVHEEIERANRDVSAAHEGIRIAECDDIETEIAYAVTWMKRLVREDGLRYSDMAIVLADMKGMSSKVARALKKAGIPCFMDVKKNILGTGPSEMVRAAISVVRTDYAYESVFRFVKALPDDLKEGMDDVENFVRSRGIRGARRYRSEWTGKVYRHYPVDFDEINKKRLFIVDLLEPFVKVMNDKNLTVNDMVGAAKALLEKCGIREKLEESVERLQTSTDEEERLAARENAQLYDGIMSVLDHASALLGNDVISVKEFADILDTGFAKQELALLPPSGDCVLVGDIERSRVGEVRALFVMGLGDDVVPVREGGNTILSEADRELFATHDITLSPTRKQAIQNSEFYMYLCFSKPSEKLFLSYHKSNGKSQIRPAYVIAAVMKLFGGIKPDPVPRNAKEISVGADGGVAMLARLIGSRKSDKLSDEELLILENVRKESPSVFDRILEGAFYKTGGKDITPAVAKQIYGDVILNSVTSLERYASCAYAYFLRYGLRCEEETEPGLAATDFGTIYHKALEVYGKTLRKQKISWHEELEEGKKKKFISAAIEEAVKEYAEEMGESARVAYAKTRVERVLGLTINVIENQVRAGSFEPEYLEESFGKASEFGNVQGRIDRIDVCRKNGRTFLRVVDYKTGSAEFDLNLLYHGIKVQLALYTKVAVELLKSKGEKNPEPAGAYFYKIDDPTIECDQKIEDEQLFAEKTKKLRMSGPSDGEPVKIISQDRELGSDDGTLGASKRSSVLNLSTGKECMLKEKNIYTAEQFGEIFGHITKLFNDKADDILSGKIPLNPYDYGKTDPCKYCPYHGICGFDEKLGASRRKIEDLPAEEIFKMMKS